LFPSEWPAYAWIANLAYPVVILLIVRVRKTSEGERTVVAGMIGLLAVFLLSVPLSAMHVSLAVPMQVNRVFCLMDFVASACIALWWMDRAGARWSAVVRSVCIAVIAALAIARGTYVLNGEHRKLIEIKPAPSPWMETMDWLKLQPEPWHVLVDPTHAWK